MIQGLRHGLKKFWSEVFSGDLLILSLSIVLAVTSLSSVSFLGDRLQTSLKLQASSILGADLVLRSASKIDSQYIDLGQVNDLKTGLWETYNEDGEIFSIGRYINDYQNGDWKYFHKSGNILSYV